MFSPVQLSVAGGVLFLDNLRTSIKVGHKGAAVVLTCQWLVSPVATRLRPN
jgi:hypothetical protein